MGKRVRRIDVIGDLERGIVFESTIKDPIEFTIGGKIYLIRPGLIRTTGRYVIDVDKIIDDLKKAKKRGDKELIVVITSGGMTEEVYIPSKLFDSVLLQLYEISLEK